MEKTTNFAKEFSLYENLFSNGNSPTPTHQLKESRTAADIQAEIERLQQELQQAQTTEKSAEYNGNFPTELWAWDMYLKDRDKGTWCSAEKYGIDWEGRVFETEDDAFNAGLTLLRELSDEGELKGDPDEYTIDTFSIPITELTVELLEESELDHLIPAIIE